MKTQIQNTAKLLSRNILSTTVVIGIMSVAAFAAAPTGGYTPGATLNPNCAPGDTDCVVTITDKFKFIDGTDTDDAVYSTGNVGIGVIAPTEKLDIDGAVRYSGIVPQHITATDNYEPSDITSELGQGFYHKFVYNKPGYLPAGAVWGSTFGFARSSSAYAYSWQWSVDNTGLTSYRGANSDGTWKMDPYFSIKSNGNFGIGTTNPSQKLDVNGAINTTNSSGYQVRNAADSANLTILNLGGSDDVFLGHNSADNLYLNSGNNDNIIFTRGGTETVRINSLGNVGVGTTTPGAKLHSVGDIMLGGLNSASSTLLTTPVSGTNINGSNLILRGGSSTGSGTSGQVRIFPGTDSSASGSTINGNGVTHGLYLDQQRTHWNNHPNLFRMSTVLGRSSDEGNRSGLQGAGSSLTIDGTITGTNNVGTLELVGSNNGGGGGQGFIRFYGSSQKNPYATIRPHTVGGDYTSGDLRLNTYNAGVENTVMSLGHEGYVGIGINDPKEALDVYGKISARESFELRRSTDNSKKIADITWNAPDNGFLYNNNNGGYHAFSSNVNGEVMRVATNGNVGVGTTGPNDGKLQIADVTSGDSGVVILKNGGYNSEGNNGIRIFDTTALNQALHMGIDATENIGYVQAMDPATSWSTVPLVLQGAGGNVGIGTTDPNSKLSVVGLPSGTTDGVVSGSLAGAVCITTTGNMYIDTDGTCAN